MRRASARGTTGFGVLCKVLEKDLQRQLQGFERQEVRHYLRAPDARADVIRVHQHSRSAPDLVTLAASNRQSLVAGEQTDGQLLHGLRAEENVSESDDASAESDIDDDDDGDDEEEEDGDEDDSSGDNMSLSEVKAELWRAVSAGVKVEESMLSRWLQSVYSRPLSDQERACVAAFVRKAISGAKKHAEQSSSNASHESNAKTAATSHRRSASEHSALVSTAAPSPPQYTRHTQRPTRGDYVRVLPGHARVHGLTLPIDLLIGYSQYTYLLITYLLIGYSQYTYLLNGYAQYTYLLIGYAQYPHLLIGYAQYTHLVIGCWPF